MSQINPSIHQSINPSIHQSINPSIHQSINPSIHQSINPSIHQSINPSKMDSLTRTLPASWFCSPALYQVERRAAFLKVDPTTSVLWQSNTI
jgi:hypothetical protein